MSVTAILTPSTTSDSECMVSFYTGDELLRSMMLERIGPRDRDVATLYAMENGTSGPVSKSLEGTTLGKAVKVPTTGSLIFHVASLLIKQGFVCLLRGDGGE